MKKRLMVRRFNKLERLAWHVGNAYRTDEQDSEMKKLFEELRKAGIQTGWEPVARKYLEE